MAYLRAFIEFLEFCITQLYAFCITPSMMKELSVGELIQVVL